MKIFVDLDNTLCHTDNSHDYYKSTPYMFAINEVNKLYQRFNNEYLKNISCKSLFGDIFSHHKAFSYTYDNYSDHLKVKKVAGPFVKVWTGR